MRICINLQHERKLHIDSQRLSPHRIKQHCELVNLILLLKIWFLVGMNYKNEHYACQYGGGKQVWRVVATHLCHNLLLRSNVHGELHFRYTQS